MADEHVNNFLLKLSEVTIIKEASDGLLVQGMVLDGVYHVVIEKSLTRI